MERNLFRYSSEVNNWSTYFNIFLCDLFCFLNGVTVARDASQCKVFQSPNYIGNNGDPIFFLLHFRCFAFLVMCETLFAIFIGCI